MRKPRLRKKGKGEGGEVPVPAYEAMRGSPRLSQRIWEVLMLGLSTRKYAEVLPKMAETVGVSKSEVSRHFVEGSAEKLKELMASRASALMAPAPPTTSPARSRAARSR